MSSSPLAFWERPLFDRPEILLEGCVCTDLDKGHQNLFHGDLKASVQNISVDLVTSYSLRIRALGCNIFIVSLDFWQPFV